MLPIRFKRIRSSLIFLTGPAAIWLDKRMPDHLIGLNAPGHASFGFVLPKN
jgi:hypothetical protein